MNELTIHLQPNDKKPMYEQLYDYIKNEIRQGTYPAGDKLPSTRALSAYLQVSRSTVDLAYEQLLSEGYVEAVPCRGYFVCDIAGLYEIEPEAPGHEKSEENVDQSCLYDFSPNGIDLDSFPFKTWRKLSKDILIDDKKELFQQGDPKGEYSLRETICRYLHQARGVNCRPEQVIVGAGNDYLLLLLGTVLGENRRIAMENPTYKQAYRIFKSLNYEVAAVGMDAGGMREDELEASGADVAYVMPSHQFPMGVVMPIKRRLALLDWAKRGEERYLLEDDYDSEFRYKGKPIPALQGYDKSGKVIYLGTFSKSLAPSIRISYMVLPPKLLERYESRSAFFSSTVSRVDQILIGRFIREGYYERHLNKMRAVYKAKHDCLLEQMKRLASIGCVFGENAGVHILFELTGGMNGKEAVERARSAGVRVYGLSEYLISPPGEAQPVLVMGYASMEEEEIKEAINLLVHIWKK